MTHAVKFLKKMGLAWPRVIVGICAMGKKTLSKPMKEILSRLDEFDYIQTLIFPEDIILNVSKDLQTG